MTLLQIKSVLIVMTLFGAFQQHELGATALVTLTQVALIQLTR
jgi:hypothetical protein